MRLRNCEPQTEIDDIQVNQKGLFPDIESAENTAEIIIMEKSWHGSHGFATQEERYPAVSENHVKMDHVQKKCRGFTHQIESSQKNLDQIHGKIIYIENHVEISYDLCGKRMPWF